VALWLNFAGVEVVGAGKGGEITQGVIVPPNLRHNAVVTSKRSRSLRCRAASVICWRERTIAKNWVEMRDKGNKYNR